MSEIRVLIVDDDPLVRSALSHFVSRGSDVTVIGQAESGREALEFLEHDRPDVVMMDVQMPEMNGIEATRRVLAADPSIGVLVFTMGEDDGTLLSAMRAGARGYLVKGASQEEVTRAITAVHAGGVVFGASLASRIGELLSPSPARTATEFPMLTEREREVLDLIAAGRSNSQIAAELFLAPKTVRNNVSAILSKLQATDRAEVIIRARDAGMGQRD